MSGNLTSYHSFEAGGVLPNTNTNSTTSGAVHLAMTGGKKRTYSKNLCNKKSVRKPNKCKKVKGCKVAKGTKRAYCRKAKNKSTKKRRPTKKRHHGMRTKSAQSKLNTVKRGFRYLRGGAAEHVWRGDWDNSFERIKELNEFNEVTQFQIVKKNDEVIDGSAENYDSLIDTIKDKILHPDVIKTVQVV